jgi:hypothetical protein
MVLLLVEDAHLGCAGRFGNIASHAHENMGMTSNAGNERIEDAAWVAVAFEFSTRNGTWTSLLC